jgi:hypothetical protein
MIDDHLPELTAPDGVPPEALAAAAVATTAPAQRSGVNGDARVDHDPWSTMLRWGR